MKKVIKAILIISCGFLFGCERVGFFNVKIQNLASDLILIEGIEDIPCDQPPYGRICIKGGIKINQDHSRSFGLSHYRWGRSYLTKKPEFQELYGIKIYYKSKSCLIFKYNIFNDIAPLYEKMNYSRRSDNSVLALTVDGLEIMTESEYKANKDKYTINDSNVKCIKE